MQRVTGFLLAGSLVLAVGVLFVGCNGEFDQQDLSPETHDIPQQEEPLQPQQPAFPEEAPGGFEPPQQNQQQPEPSF